MQNFYEINLFSKSLSFVFSRLCRYKVLIAQTIGSFFSNAKNPNKILIAQKHIFLYKIRRFHIYNP